MNMSEPRFYVYKLLGVDGTLLYVGKGSGRRLAIQMSRRKCAGEIIGRFAREREAYAYEIVAIKELKPPENKNPGGGGPRVRARSRRRFGWEIEIDRVGSRRYTARALLKFDLSGHVDPSKLDIIRQVANGPRC